MASCSTIYILGLIGIVHSLNLTSVDRQSDISVIKREISGLKASVEKLNSTVGSLQAKLEKYNASNHHVDPVAFAACIGSALKTIGPHQAIEFDHVILNEGGAYDPRHGIFRAPVPGVYRFVVTFINEPGSPVWVEIVKDGSRLAYGYSDRRQHSEGTVQINVKLEAGEDVWCRNAYSIETSHLNPDGQYSCFSGFMI